MLSWRVLSGRIPSSSSATTKAADPTTMFPRCRPLQRLHQYHHLRSGTPDIGVLGIAVNPDTTAQQPNLYFPCVQRLRDAELHCDLGTLILGLTRRTPRPCRDLPRSLASACPTRSSRFHQEALCFAHADGSHGGDQVRRRPIYRQPRVPD